MAVVAGCNRVDRCRLIDHSERSQHTKPNDTTKSPQRTFPDWKIIVSKIKEQNQIGKKAHHPCQVHRQTAVRGYSYAAGSRVCRSEEESRVASTIFLETKLENVGPSACIIRGLHAACFIADCVLLCHTHQYLHSVGRKLLLSYTLVEEYVYK